MIPYRLGDYRIIDDEDGELRWESYAGFGRSISGKCFMVGNVLFLEPSREINENSYLLLEYHEFLDKLPRWEKTKYYCSSYTIRTCETGRIPSGHEISSRSHEQAKEVSHTGATEMTESGAIRVKQSAEIGAISYKLGQYEVIENENRELSWKVHAGLGRVRHGKCFVEDDILFVGASSEGDLIKPGAPGFLKKEFLKHLNQLPRWEKTKYYCSSYTIRTCDAGRTLPNKKTSERSSERRENPTRPLTSEMRAVASSFGQRDDSRAEFKEYINKTKKWLVSTGAHILSGCTAFCGKLFDRRKGGENRGDQKSRNRNDDRYVS